jgi:peroxiredoxin
MIEEGAQAPTFELPGIRNGEFVQIDASEVFGGGIVVLAFYPGDFNPACSGTKTDLDELDLFTMQKDVAVLAISGDSVHSHRAFAEEFNLEMTLLSDLRGEVARRYGVAVEDEAAGHLTKRAVFVVDHTETVQYAWATDDLEELPDVDEIRDTVQGIGDDDTAQSRYRVGHARYVEGRRAFTSAMNAYEEREWMMAQTDFAQAAEEFDEALEEFNTAVRFSESERTQTYFDRAEEKAEALWRASEWLSESAGAFASGSGRKAESLRSDAEEPLETVRELHEPPDPDGFPPEEDPAERDDEEAEPDRSWLDDEEEIDTSLDADIDAELDADATEDDAANGDETAASGEAGIGGETEASEEGAEVGDGAPESAAASDKTEAVAASDDADDEGDDGAAIDDAELEEITAELEEQTEAAQEDAEETEPEPGGGNVVPQELDAVDDSAAGDQEETAAADADATDVGADGPRHDDSQTADTSAAEAESTPAGNSADDGGGESNETAAQETDSEEDIELDLTDPTEGEDEADDQDDGEENGEDEEDVVNDEALGESGDHGVPDSL